MTSDDIDNAENILSVYFEYKRQGYKDLVKGNKESPDPILKRNMQMESQFVAFFWYYVCIQSKITHNYQDNHKVSSICNCLF